MHNRNGLAMLFATTALAAASHSEAFAQSTQQAPQRQASALEEVIVTARRTEERAQTVPIAVTALSASVLQEQRITQFEDLQYNVPGLSFNQANNRDNIRIQIRGQTQSIGSQFPGVETLVAEVPVQPGGSLPLYDLESVQVLKGPQGVAFGRDATGGAVLLYPARPRDEFSGYVDVTLGNYNARDFEAMVNIPLIPDKLMLRAAGRIERRDGDVHNLTTGDYMDNQHTDNWRLSLLAKPTSWLENYTVVEGYGLNILGSADRITVFDHSMNSSAYALYGPTFFAQAEQSATEGRDITRATADGFNRANQLFLSNTTSIEINDHLRLKNVLGYQTLEQSSSNDQDGMPIPMILFGLPTGQVPINQTLSDEFQVQGDAMSGRLKWLVGVYASQQTPIKKGDPQVAIVFAPFVPLTATNAWNRLTSLAPFSQVQLPLDFISHKLSLTMGVRYTEDTQYQVATSIPQTSGAIINCGLTSCTLAGGVPAVSINKGSWSGLNYAFTLDYQATDRLLTYIAHRHGFKGGSFNAFSPLPEYTNVQPEYVDDIEGGLKSDWSFGDIHGRTNIAVYYEWWTNIVRTFNFVALATTLDRNVAAATIQGAELETTVIPMRGVEVTGSYAYTLGRYTQSLVPLAITQFPDVPEHRVNLNARYTLPLDSKVGSVMFEAQYSYTSSHYLNQNATYVPGILPGYSLVNLNASWKRIYGSPVDATLWVKNLADTHYFMGGAELYDDIGFNAGIMGEPRTFGIELRYHFGAG